MIDMTIIPAARIDDLKTHESTIKTSAPRGALRVFCNLIFGFIYITSEVVFIKVYVRRQGNMTILETGEYQATVPDKQCKGGAAASAGKGSGI